MIQNKTKRLVTSGLFLTMGILLPFITSHAYRIPGTVFLPMHIPVLLCGFFCGPLLGAVCGAILPFLNSIITGMPAMYPNAITMTAELFTYGLLSGLLYKFFKHNNKLICIFSSLILSMLAGRIASGLMASVLLFFNPLMTKTSVIASIITGIPGIIIQLVLIPAAVRIFNKTSEVYDAKHQAIEMIKNKSATCVVVKNNKIVSAESPTGISYILKLYEDNQLEGAFVADTIVGKAAAMIFDLGKISGCYAQTMSKHALEWLNTNSIEASYGTLVQEIENRTKTGNCPMENTVKNLTDTTKAYIALKNKVEELKSANKK